MPVPKRGPSLMELQSAELARECDPADGSCLGLAGELTDLNSDLNSAEQGVRAAPTLCVPLCLLCRAPPTSRFAVSARPRTPPRCADGVLVPPRHRILLGSSQMSGHEEAGLCWSLRAAASFRAVRAVPPSRGCPFEPSAPLAIVTAASAIVPSSPRSLF